MPVKQPTMSGAEVRVIHIDSSVPEPDVNFTCSVEELNFKKDYWRKTMTTIKYVVAPMINQSELAFRELMRAHGADLAFSPMIKADQFVSDPAYREKSLGTWKGERHKPFIIQFVGTNPETFLIACRYVEGYCDGVDIDLSYSEEIAQMENLCLQNKRDRYVSIVSKVFKKCLLPISVKMRCEETTADTIEYAKLLEEAGASMITVHGRTQEMTGVSTGIADWSHIAAVKSELHIPVIANGNIQLPGDVERCIQATGCDAVMSAEGILYNPYLFENTFKPNVQVAREYVSYAKMFSATMSAVTEHIFRICQYSLHRHEDLRNNLFTATSFVEIEAIINAIESREENSKKKTDCPSCPTFLR